VATSERQRTAPELPTCLASDLGWLLSHVSHTLTTESTAALEGSGISPRGHAVLAAAMSGEYAQTELARMIGLDKTTMVVTVDDLEAQGLVERTPSKSDRRARLIKVTEEGRRKVEVANQVLDRVRDDVLQALPVQEREVFVRALARLASGRLAEPVPCAQPVRRRG
jgi:MarR family transcriptional regulator, transcriptional regulator for hemolysin